MMRIGGGQAKGADFERAMCVRLSLWLSRGARADLFTRNVLSGGRFTRKLDKGDTELGNPGDILGAHPLAYEFLQYMLVECKHHKDVQFDTFVCDFNTRKAFLWTVYEHALKQARHIGALPVLIVKSNRVEPVLICGPAVLKAAREARAPRLILRYHEMHRAGSDANDAPGLGMMHLSNFVATVNPVPFIAAVRRALHAER